MCRECPNYHVCQIPCAKLAAELEAVTVGPNGWEVIVSLDQLVNLWTSRSRLSLAALQGASVLPPLEVLFPVLTKKQKKILVLKFVYQRTEREIAKALGIHRKSVYENIWWARKKVLAFVESRQNSTPDTPANYEG